MTRIAIVEDERTIRTSLRMALEAEAFEVETYENPVIALPKLLFSPPTLLILNGHMPGMLGIDFFVTFRAFSKAPVIFLTASPEEIQDELERRGCPADEYIAKPFSHRLIIARVRRLLAARGVSCRGS